ncbi:cyclin-L2-like protein [Sarcoptes scabiei]|uniref:Cyclin-L2-like protein n=1 Tax=Sarcoptes scabiei TaxID=52283 RepID=A0A131ZSL9_SARSC|nr:cyclin-L2-like protein [Sarcoptes scabiei]
MENSVIHRNLDDENSQKKTKILQQTNNDMPESVQKLKYGKVLILLENPILPAEKIINTPSMADGLDFSIENDLRIIGCHLIQISGILLRLPQVAMATGQVLFQRFYYSKSFVRLPMEITAMACVVLASKVEEAPRRIRDIINPMALILDDYYVSMKNQVIKAERRILKELGFCVHVKHPHKFIVAVAQILKHERNFEMIQSAWSYMNDSLQTNVFVRFPPESIACACVHLSARILKVPLPTKPSWYELFNVDTETIEAICKSILMLYTRKPLSQEILEQKVAEVRLRVEKEKMEAKKRILTSNSDMNEMNKLNSPILSESQTNTPKITDSVTDNIILEKNYTDDRVLHRNLEIKSFITQIINDKTNEKHEQEMEIQTKDDKTDSVSDRSASSSSQSSFKLQKSPITRKIKTSKKHCDYDDDNNEEYYDHRRKKYQSRGDVHHRLSSSVSDYKNGHSKYVSHERYRDEEENDRSDQRKAMKNVIENCKLIYKND